MKRGQVYLLRLDPTEASEQADIRPGVIVSRNAINQYSPVVVICPITDAAHISKTYPSDILIKAPEGGLDKDSIVLSAQVRAITKSRLIRYLGELGPDTVKKINRALKITIDLQ